MPQFHTRRLPHFHATGQPIFVTCCLAGSLTGNRRFPSATTDGKAFAAMDRLLDTIRTGYFHLRRPEIATMVVEALHHLETQDTYRLHRYAVMPNHLHLLLTPLRPVSKITQSLKRFTAREANKILGVTGQPFWQDESYDRLVRDQAEFERIADYIGNNPVVAGLCASADDFPWSSAGRIENPPQVTNLPHKNT